MKKVLIIGNYGAGNLGDEAILESLLGLCGEVGLAPAVLSPAPAMTERRHGVKAARPFPAGVRSFLRGTERDTRVMLEHADAVILGGGGLFNEEAPRAPLIWYRQVQLAMKLGKPLYCLGQSVGPLRSAKAREMVRRVFDYAVGVSVRDLQSKKLLVELGVDGKKVVVTSDLALLLPSQPRVKKSRFRRVVVSLRRWQRSEEQVLDVLGPLLGRFFDEVLLLPMGDDDAVLLADLRLRVALPHENIRLLEPGTSEDIQYELARANLVIGMRLHALVLAATQGVPAIGLAYSEKVANFCGQVGYVAFDPRRVGAEHLLPLLKKPSRPELAVLEKLRGETREKTLKLLRGI